MIHSDLDDHLNKSIQVFSFNDSSNFLKLYFPSLMDSKAPLNIKQKAVDINPRT